MCILARLSAVVIVVGGLVGFQASAEAQPYMAAPPAPAVFVYHGQRYCFAPDGWNGPGWYWCGYAHRHGFGWGGPVGWHGWTVGWHRGWNPRWGHGPAVVAGGWHPRGWYGWGWRPHGRPHWGHPYHWHPGHHGGPHHWHGGHPHRGHGGHRHHGHGGHRRTH